MEPRTIIKAFQNGAITQEAAEEQLIEHSSPAYLAGVYLECVKQRNEYRTLLYAEQDKTNRPTIEYGIVIDLIDHALSTSYISTRLAERWYKCAQMDPDNIANHIQTILSIRDRNAIRADFLDGPDHAPRYCTRCGIKVKAKDISRRSLCIECGYTAIEQAVEQLQAKAGPIYRKWRDAMIKVCYKLENEIIAAPQDREPSTLGDMIDRDKPQCDDGDCLNCDAPNCVYRVVDYNPDDPNFSPF